MAKVSFFDTQKQDVQFRLYVPSETNPKGHHDGPYITLIAGEDEVTFFLKDMEQLNAFFYDLDNLHARAYMDSYNREDGSKYIEHGF